MKWMNGPPHRLIESSLNKTREVPTTEKQVCGS